MTESKPNWAAFTAAWVGWVLDAFDFTIYIVVAQKMIAEFGVSPTAIGGSLTLTLLVRLLGGFVAGWMADRWGRKLPLMMSLVWFAAFDAAIYFAPSFTWVLIFRTLFGFGMGAEWTAGTSLAMESFPPSKRKLASGLLQAGWPIGFLMAAALGMFVVPAWGWRAMFLIAAVPAILVIPIRMFVPDNHVALDAAAAAAGNTVVAKTKGAISELLEPGIRKMIILGSLVMALGFVVYYGMVTTQIGVHFEVANCGKNAACLKTTMDHAWMSQIWFNVGMLIGVIGAGWVANRFGVITALVVPALLMVPAMPLYVGMSPGLLTVGAFLGGALGVGYSGVTPVLTTSLFPAHVRARAIGVVYHVGALLAAFVPTLIPWLSKTAHMSLANTVLIVVGTGLIAMSAAVLALRGYLAIPAAAAEEQAIVTEAVRTSPSGSTKRELSDPVADAIVDREVARAAERRAILG